MVETISGVSYRWDYDTADRLVSEAINHWDNDYDQTESYLLDLVGNRIQRTVDKVNPAQDRTFITSFDTNDRLLSEQEHPNLTGTGGSDRSTTYTWANTQQASKTVTSATEGTQTQLLSYGLGGKLESVVLESRSTTNVLQSRSRVDYRYDTFGIRFLSIDWNDANLDNTFAAGERTGSTEFLIERNNETGHPQAIIETEKNAAGLATKRTTYGFGHDEVTQTTSMSLNPKIDEVSEPEP